MKDVRKTKDHLIQELNEARQLISDLKESQSGLMLDMATLEDLFAATPTGIALVQDRKFVMVNPSLCRTLGYSAADMLGMSTRMLYPDEEEYNHVGMDMYEEAERRGLCVGDIRAQRKDGSIIHVRLSMSPLDPDDISRGVCVSTVDITGQKRTEKALLESEEKYRLLVENAGDVINVAQDGMIKFSNTRAEELLGYTREEIMAAPFVNFIHPDDRSMVMDYHRRRMRGVAVPDVYAFRIIDKAGSTKWAEIRVVRIPWEGRPASLNFISDITERKRLEHTQRESEERLRGITNNLPGLVFQFVAKNNGEWQIPYHSERVQDIFGLADEEMADLFQTFMRYTHTDDLEDLMASIQKAAQTCSPWNHECRIITPQGKQLWMHGMSTPTRHEDRVIFNGIMLDITERKQAEEALRKSEERYRTILDSIEEAYFELDLMGNFTFFNEFLCRFFGYSRQELTGMSYRAYTTTETAERAFRIFNEIFATGRPNSKVIYDVVRKDGSKIMIEMAVALKRDPSGNPIGFRGIGKDITKSIEAEQALRESEEKFRSIFEHAPLSMAITDMDSHIVDANSRMCERSGLRKAELIGRAITDTPELARPENPDDLIRISRKLLEQGWLRNEEMQMIRPSNNERSTILLSSRVITISDKPHVMSMILDITERKQAEDVIRKSEERYRTIFEGTATANIIVAADTTILMANDNFASLVGYSKEELEGKVSWTQFVVREDLERVRRNQIMRGIDPGSVPPSYELRAINRNGETKDLFMSVAVIPGTKESVASLIDITDWKISERARAESEVRFQEFARLLPEAAYEADSNGAFTFVNQAWFEKCGYTEEDFSRGVTVFDVIVPEDHPRMRAAYRKLLRSERLGFEEYTMRKKNGSTFPALVYATTMYQDGKPVGHRGFTVDVSERRNLEEQLLTAQKMESIGRLAGGVAHDFNNMLSVIIGNAEMAMANLDVSDPLHRTLQDILNAGNRSADLTRQLLAFARKQTIAPKVIDLNDTVSGMLKMLHRLIGENIDLSWTPGRNPWKIRIDPSQVDQLLANLTVNARDAIDKSGRIIIETSNELCDEAYCVDKPECVPGEYLMLAVSDNGCGMDRQTLANIFEPFFTTKKEGQGTGLGLATVYGIVRQNNGFINVYSEPGKGTTFRLYIPRHRAKSMETAEEPAETKVQGGTETVLIVEDDPSISDLTGKIV
ncbi:MAG TPA: PAS domain S-box protein, partial [Deltaproteobacteria bacterium]|nr:PAS domain S-box protein [Deltaproteobacteria bacterium]